MLGNRRADGRAMCRRTGLAVAEGVEAADDESGESCEKSTERRQCPKERELLSQEA